MRRLLTGFLILLSICVLSCDGKDPEGVFETVQWDTHVVRDINYIKDTYFYFYNPYLGALPLPEIETLDVFREVKPNDKLVDPDLISLSGRAFVDFDGSGQTIEAALASLAG